VPTLSDNPGRPSEGAESPRQTVGARHGVPLQG